MLTLMSPTEAEGLRGFFSEIGYIEKTLRERLGLWELPSSRLHNLARLQDLTREPSCLNTLLRWFWIGASERASMAAEYVPAWFTTLSLSVGLLRQDGEHLVSDVMLVPVEGFYVASDQPSKIDSEDSQTVLWPNPTSRLLSRFTVRRHSRSTLDLGTGCGIQALAAAAHSEHVVATDLNPRAREFASFNARMNGFESIECLLGDGLEPVSGRKFDLIVSNPPFFCHPFPSVSLL